MIETRFKHTEIGRIPEDWATSTIEEMAIITTGSQNTQDHKENGKYLFYVRSQQIERIDKWIFDTEGVVTAGDGVGTGKVFHYVNGKFGLHQRCYLIHQFKGDVDAKYFFWIFSNTFYDRVHSMTAKSSVDSVRREMIADMLVALPPKPEQKRIAAALCNIDALISGLGKLIDKKRDIKQGAMQQLLTGKKRLKGFSEPWVEKQLGKIGCTFSGLTGKKKDDFGTGDAKYITFLNVLNNPILNPKLFEDVVVKHGERHNSCHKGDLFFNTSSETPEEVGICAMLDIEQDSLYLNSFCFGYRLHDKNIVPEYLAYYFRSNEGRNLMTGLAQGVTRYNLSKSAFTNAKIFMPENTAEQKAIADVLRYMDKEIESIESKKAKYEQIKQGMIQQLLTGKIRLVDTIAKTNTKVANVHFRRSVLAAEIADRLCEEPTFGHVKMEKILFLTERLCRIDIGSHYHRDAAGPYDNNALRSIDSQLKKQKWFEVQRTEKGNRYIPMQNRGNHKTYFNRYYSDVTSTFDKIINTFKTQRTEQCEIVATLYSAWEDLLHGNKSFNDADIVNEVLNNWHESKKRISKERWLTAIQWMRENGFAPNV